ncbi:hypothetical protein SPRG_00072 [Saprolegnia parasitica CBS 223.65]|uniref:Uncharacterized protein n=1 Tax=Saprolegnia parasitica (strain CBS 223.65) TaxID=695850 RepID=A0A067D9D2_SAPPC|nr:hypothetical protein SPRG_00072 [Saprolegnia parasitica CBS 223.65]KDO35226.1 hypothetical protein SPRG_00072 [Saprolegnia parasitica CBS 223.65]|eukprot:XP_012193578.1 hypothetical protein SPRG_00072 [Saprolegnia parasitica CBS 223.65]
MERGSYFQEYMRSKALANPSAGKQAVAETKKLFTDRGAYISFLEVQLERVSAACLHTQGLETQLHTMRIALEAAEAKIGTVTKLLKLHQQHSGEMVQSASQDISTLQDAIEGLREAATIHSTQLRRLDARQNELDEVLQSVDARGRSDCDSLRMHLDTSRETMELQVHRYHTLMDAQHNRWSSLQASQQELARELSLLETRLVEHTDKHVAMVRDEATDQGAAMEARFVEIDEKLKRSRQSIEQYCAVELARHACAVETRFESVEQKEMVLNEQLGRHQNRVQQLLQRHQEDARLLNTTLLSLQNDIERVEARHDAMPGKAPAATTSNDARLLTLEKDYAICREGLAYLRTVMEHFEATQLQLVDGWNSKMASLTSQVECHARSDSVPINASEVGERLAALEAIWDPAVLQSFVKGIGRVQKVERKMQRLVENVQTLYTLVEMTLPKRATFASGIQDKHAQRESSNEVQESSPPKKKPSSSKKSALLEPVSLSSPTRIAEKPRKARVASVLRH